MPDLFVAPENQPPASQQITPETQPTQQPTDTFVSSLLNEPPHRIGMFTSFREKPAGISFQTQEEDEEVLLLLRKDFITNVPWIFFTIIFSIIPFFLQLLFQASGSPLGIPANFILIIALFYYLIIITYAFVSFITWYFNVSLVTQKRVLDIDFSDLVYKNVAETKLNLVQDVSYTQIGVIRSIFDYGDVLVQTAGTTENFRMEAVPRPALAVHIIENLIGKNR